MTSPIFHAMKPGFVDELTTKCGMKIRKGLSKRHMLAINEAAATCVPCAAVVAAELEVKRMQRGPVPAELSKYYDWADGPDSGISSKTIVKAITGAHVVRWRDESPPADPSDFGRCHRLLQLFPELRQRLPEVAERYPEWRPLVDAWTELEALYLEELPSGTAPRLYARMRELLAKDGGACG